MHYLDICSRNRGVIHRNELLAAGLSKYAIHRMVERGELIPELPRVYRLRGAPRTWLQLVTSVSRWAERSSAVTGPAAAAVYGIEGFREQGPIDLVTTRSLRRPRADVRIHRVRSLPAAHIVDRVGIRVASPSRLLVDLAPTMPIVELEKVFERLIRRRVLEPSDLVASLDDLPTGTPGLAACRRLLRARSRVGAPAESDLEVECLQDLRRGGAPPPVRQHWIGEGSRRVGRIDLAYPHVRLGIEVDGYEWHGGFGRFHADRARYNAVTALGWRLLLYTKKTDKRVFVDQVLGILAGAQGRLL